MAKKAEEAIQKGATRAKAATDKAAAATKNATDRAAKAAKDATDRVAAGAKAAAERVEAAGESVRQSGEKLKASGEKVAKQGSALSLKMIEHAEANAREAFAAMRAAASSGSPAEIARIQADYLQAQGARSLTYAREISEMIVQIGKDAAGMGKK